MWRTNSETLLASGCGRRFDGQTWTRLTYVFYAGAHEQYHCGQLATYARFVAGLQRR